MTNNHTITIQVPARDDRDTNFDDPTKFWCSLCDQRLEYDYHEYKPKLHTLFDCIRRLRERIEELERGIF
jgi:transcription initiation factor IIE alpha subunit